MNKKFEELKKLNEEQISEFNDRWENILYELTEESKKIEEDIINQHNAEQNRLDEEIEGLRIPYPKFSVDLLNDRFRLTQLIKNKKYEDAKILKESIETREENEGREWQRKFFVQIEKKREILFKRQKSEYDALKSRLEKAINIKLKQRMLEYEKLLQRIQNLQNELIVKQSLQFSKMQVYNSKILAKYSLNLSQLDDRLMGLLIRNTKHAKSFKG